MAPDLKYETVLRAIRQEIVSGLCAPGERLPNREYFCNKFLVGDSTVQKALDELEASGFVHSLHRKGTYISDSPPHRCNVGFVYPHSPAHSLLFHAAFRQAAGDVLRPPLKVQEYVVPLEVDVPMDRERFRHHFENDQMLGAVFPTPLFHVLHESWMARCTTPRVLLSSDGRFGSHINMRTDLFLDRALGYLLEQGAHRVAHLVYASPLGDTRLMDVLRKRQVEVNPLWVQALLPANQSPMALNLVHLLMRLRAEDRPDALIVHDDNLVETVVAGLQAAGVRPGVDLPVVAHTNFPLVPAADAPLVRLGFDCRRIVSACVGSLQAQRRGEEPDLVSFTPQFSWELEDALVDQPV